MFSWLRMPTESRGILLWAFRLDILIIVVSWILLWWSEWVQTIPPGTEPKDFIKRWYHIPIHLIAGTSLILIAIVTFFGFYFASTANGDDFGHATRNAIAASFVGLYLVILPYILLSPQYFSSLLGTQAVNESDTYARQLFTGFSTLLTTIIAFYFASQVLDKASNDVKLTRIEQSRIAAAAEVDIARANAQAAGGGEA